MVLKELIFYCGFLLVGGCGLDSDFKQFLFLKVFERTDFKQFLPLWWS